MRNGPGTEFAGTTTLNASAEVNVVGFDGPTGEWAQKKYATLSNTLEQCLGELRKGVKQLGFQD